MKHLIVFFTFFLILGAVQGQLPTYFRDDFKTNIYRWKLHPGGETSAQIAEDHLILEKKNNSGSYFQFWRHIFFNQNADYYIEARLKQSQGDPKTPFGLSWGSTDGKNCYYFLINSNQSYHIFAYTKGRYYFIDKKHRQSFIRPKGENNVLAIKKQGRKMFFYLNGQEIYSSGYRSFFGYMTGFVLTGKSRIEVDYFLIKNPIPSPELVRSEPALANQNDLYWAIQADTTSNNAQISVSGYLRDQATNAPLAGKVKITDPETSEMLASVQSDAQTGFFSLFFSYTPEFQIGSTAADHVPVGEILSVKKKKRYTEIQHNLHMPRIELGKAVQLHNVFFVRASSTLLEKSYAELDRIAELMTNYPEIEIELAGHTDNRGDASLNKELSEKRVDRVKDYLVNQGISKRRISGKGYGGEHPLVNGDSEQARKQNRRVEFRIVKK